MHQQALDPQPGSRVVDLCAAPGGKATALAQLMGDRGTLVALERSANKVSLSVCSWSCQYRSARS